MERLVGFVLFLLLGPSLVLIAAILHITSDDAILLKDEMVMDDGRLVHGFRFRTTGSGTTTFGVVGRFLRKNSFDEWPLLWSVACGEIRLREFGNMLRPK